MNKNSHPLNLLWSGYWIQHLLVTTSLISSTHAPTHPLSHTAYLGLWWQQAREGSQATSFSSSWGNPRHSQARLDTSPAWFESQQPFNFIAPQQSLASCYLDPNEFYALGPFKCRFFFGITVWDNAHIVWLTGPPINLTFHLTSTCVQNLRTPKNYHSVRLASANCCPNCFLWLNLFLCCLVCDVSSTQSLWHIALIFALLANCMAESMYANLFIFTEVPP